MFAPGLLGSKVTVKPRYDNFIGGAWVPPVHGEYMVDLTPATGQPITQVARSTAQEVELALDATHASKEGLRSDPCSASSRVWHDLV